MTTYKTTVLIDGLGFPEGPRWHEGKLWFSDMRTKKVMRVDLDGNAKTIIAVPNEPSGLGWTQDGRLLVVSMADRRLMRLDPTGLVEVADLSGLVSSTINDMVVNSKGSAYIGSFGYEFGAGEPRKPGEILLVTPDGDVRIAADGLGFPNGMVITPDETTFIFAETLAARLSAFTIKEDGSLADYRTWAQFDARGFQDVDINRVMPDGICLDVEGAVWLASPGRDGEVLRVLEGGEITDRVSVDREAFACMLGGLDRRTLFVCTSKWADPALDVGCIETTRVPVPGAGLP